MNGRVQDPVLGRFLSPDPIVQAPYYSQSLNRYSYVWNNPLSFADPSGFCRIYSPGGGRIDVDNIGYGDQTHIITGNCFVDTTEEWVEYGGGVGGNGADITPPSVTNIQSPVFADGIVPNSNQFMEQQRLSNGELGQSGESYLVSRPLGGDSKRFSHNFIVTDAEYIGGPNANIFSYGQNAQGRVGRVDESTTGFSEGTYAADRAAWEGLKGSSPDNPNLVEIPASSLAVRSAAEALIENRDYSAISGPFGANSNSAAQAVANRAAGVALPTPGRPRISPGAGSWREIQFRKR
jgi:hypothetical protein